MEWMHIKWCNGTGVIAVYGYNGTIITDIVIEAAWDMKELWKVWLSHPDENMGYIITESHARVSRRFTKIKPLLNYYILYKTTMWLLIHVIITVPAGWNRKERIKLKQSGVLYIYVYICVYIYIYCQSRHNDNIGVHWGIYGHLLVPCVWGSGFHSKCWTPSFDTKSISTQ